MKTLFPTLCLFLGLIESNLAQNPVQSFYEFRETNKNITYDGLSDIYPRPSDLYFKGYSLTPENNQVHFLDSVMSHLKLTPAEKSKLNDNHFFVSERLSFEHFSGAFHHVYANDLPVFISTDAILHALHSSYSTLLKTIEREMLSTNLEKMTGLLYDQLPELAKTYAGTGIDKNLADIDLYLTVAYSLITDQPQAVRLASTTAYDKVMKAIKDETLAYIPLFCDSPQYRTIDFSQFKVRGHYVYTDEDQQMRYKSLEPYFKAMMWIGRIDFFLTPPADTPWTKPWDREENRRMNIDAFLLNQLLQQSEAKILYDQHEQMINYFVGLSDNITPEQFNLYALSKNITSATQLLDDLVYDDYLLGLVTNKDFEQQIMGEALFSDANADKPDLLPLSFRLSGQRYIIDSHVFSNVVFDRVIFENKKIMRMMPLTLDAVFALGNNDAAFFLQEEIEKYHYAPNLANMHFLIDSKADSYWEGSLYNTWLNSIRRLIPEGSNPILPFFMQTTAWHQQKMNTQLAGWTQLRHDNLLYAKPSYTGMNGCSFPHSYVEPYPEFYDQLAQFSARAGSFMAAFQDNSWAFKSLPSFFQRFSTIMIKLRDLSIKELDHIAFTSSEENWLKQMLFEQSGSGMPPYSGWYGELFLNPHDMVKADYLTVDLHTQPTDELGNAVGKVLHTAVGKVNLGVFMIPQPGNEQQYMAYTGPFFSYYEKITSDFLRLTDQDWQAMVIGNTVPDRPYWTNSYLLDSKGQSLPENQELPSKFLISNKNKYADQNNELFAIFPIPTSGIVHVLASQVLQRSLPFCLTDLSGRVLNRGTIDHQNSEIDLTSHQKGLYFLNIDNNGNKLTYRILKN